MSDREWFQVCRLGTVLLDELNEDQANAGAERLAEESDSPTWVVRCRRTDVRSYQRQVTVSSTDMTVSPEAT